MDAVQTRAGLERDAGRLDAGEQQDWLEDTPPQRWLFGAPGPLLRALALGFTLGILAMSAVSLLTN